MDSKYIIFDSPTIGEFPVLFPPSVQHHMISRAILSEYPGIKPLRAGFIHFTDYIGAAKSSFYCRGESVGLKLKSDPEADRVLINDMFNIK